MAVRVEGGDRFTPYAGASFLSLGYTETSSFADSTENTSERFTGQSYFGGFDAGVTTWLAVAGKCSIAACRTRLAPAAHRRTSERPIWRRDRPDDHPRPHQR